METGFKHLNVNYDLQSLHFISLNAQNASRVTRDKRQR